MPSLLFTFSAASHPICLPAKRRRKGGELLSETLWSFSQIMAEQIRLAPGSHPSRLWPHPDLGASPHRDCNPGVWDEAKVVLINSLLENDSTMTVIART